ncbi:MAG: dTMP kinase [Anaerolineales bacterium]
MRGLFLTLEGPEGSGKSTQLPLLVSWLEEEGYAVLHTREPGGTEISERIRDLLHDPAHTKMTARAEILLYSAARAQHVEERIRPALEEGRIVLCDRFFDSTYAYQGYGRGLSLEDLRTITRFATDGLVPDVTLYLDLEPEVGLGRRRSGGGEMNRLDREALDFHRRVRLGYLKLAAADPDRWLTLDAGGRIEEVQETIRMALRPILKGRVGLGRRGGQEQAGDR